MADKFRYGIDRFNHLLAWSVEGAVSLPEMQAMALSMKDATGKLGVTHARVLLDLRSVASKELCFREEILSEWTRLLSWLNPRCSHIAVLCKSYGMKQQLDEIAVASSGVLRAFYHPDASTALRQGYAFVGIEANDVIAA